jgi:predicted component of type VI protein secretion system
VRLAVLKNNVPTDAILVETPDAGERYEIYVGRAEDCHVRIDDPLISRHHFVIKNERGGWSCQKLTKLGSVTVNGADAEGINLKDGDEIRCGVYSVVVSELGDIEGAPETKDFKVTHTVVEEPAYTAPLEVAQPTPQVEEEVPLAPTRKSPSLNRIQTMFF